MATSKLIRKLNNPVRKHLHTFNRAKIEMSKKRYKRQYKSWQ